MQSMNDGNGLRMAKRAPRKAKKISLIVILGFKPQTQRYSLGMAHFNLIYSHKSAI